MNTHVVSNRWICEECQPETSYHSQGSLRALALKVHHTKFGNIRTREIDREEMKMETREEFEG